MKRYSTILFLTIFTACSSNDKGLLISSHTSDTGTTIQADHYTLDQQPAKTIIEFLKWYRDNEGEIQNHLVNNSETYDSTKFYSVNFDATEKYLTTLLSTGFISDKYADKWRKYFKDCDDYFKNNPENDGPPSGFDYDFIMLSQDFDDDLQDVEKSKIVSQTISNDVATLKIDFPHGNKLVYVLTKSNDKWKIDDIQRE